MQRAIKLQVNVGKDHLVRLPSEFPEGPADLIVIVAPRPTTLGIDPSIELSSARRAAIGRYEGKEFYIADDFDAPLPVDLLEAFEGGSGGDVGERKP